MQSALPSAIICRSFCNQIDIKIVNYLHDVGFSMQCFIVRRLKLTQSSVSKHLKRLVMVKILTKEKIGRNTIYRINQSTFRKLAKQILDFAEA